MLQYPIECYLFDNNIHWFILRQFPYRRGVLISAPFIVWSLHSPALSHARLPCDLNQAMADVAPQFGAELKVRMLSVYYRRWIANGVNELGLLQAS